MLRKYDYSETSQILRLLTRRDKLEKPVAVQDLMREGVHTVSPDTPTLEAMRLMREKQIGCLPVVEEDDTLVGIITERDLIDLSAALLEKHLAEGGDLPNTENQD